MSSNTKSFPIIKGIIFVVFCLLGLVAYLFSQSGNGSKEVRIFAEERQDVVEIVESKEMDLVSPSETTPMKTFPVYVTGEVVKPGIFEIKEGTYLYELIECAGGFTSEAAQEAFNLASLVQANAHIHIMSMQDLEEGKIPNNSIQSESAETELVNINSANSETLQTLPGVGEKTAQAIIQYREQHGPFLAAENLMDVPGIKEQKFSALEAYITVN